MVGALTVGVVTVATVLSAPVRDGVSAEAARAPVRDRVAHDIARLPRIRGRADLAIWRHVMGDQEVFARKRAVFVRPDDDDAVTTLERLGVSARPGRWALAYLDGSALITALEESGGMQLRRSPAHRPMLDVSVAEIGAREVHRGASVELSRTGKGVLVGIIDTGVDIYHPDFLDSSGVTRVVAIWDQDRSGGREPDRFDYGHVCWRRHLEAGSCDVGDPIGHGTHVAGIAAGNRGVAPDADIAVVRSDNFTRLADAVLFLVELAEERDQGLVMNISVGGHYGAHDGRTPLEAYLREVLGPGRLAVAAAGNYGADRIHMGAPLATSQQRVALENLPWRPGVETYVDLWSQPTARVAVRLELWVDDELATAIPLNAAAEDYVEATLSFDGEPLASIGFGVELPSEHRMVQRTIAISSLGTSLPTGAFIAVSLEGQGRVDGWVSQNDYRFGTARFGRYRGEGWLEGDGEHSVTVPATGRNVIAVGAYTTRDSWVSEDLREHRISPRVPVGALSSFSSRGPTLAPEFTGAKPTIAAPGSVIESARSISVSGGTGVVDTTHMVMQGTSMAAPHVTGALALALEADPEIGPKRARRYLIDTARRDEYTGTRESNEWGFGKLNTVDVVTMAEAEASGCSATGAQPLVVCLLPVVLVWRRRRLLRR